MPDIKYESIKVKLTGTNGNAYALIGLVGTALKKHGVGQKELDEFHVECKSGDYNNLLRVCMDWVSVS